MNTPSQDRAKYNDGECLTTFQLETDQSYHKELREFWNKTLYGWGIIGESSFRLSIEDEKIRLSQGAAITSANKALLSEGFIVPVLLNGSEDINFGLVVIHGTSVKDRCQQAEAIDGENKVQLIVRDTTAGDVKWLKTLNDIENEIKATNDEGKLVVGLIERKTDKKWRADDRFRQQGPIDAPGSKDAARVANAILISSVRQSIAAKKLREFIGWGALATVLSILLWILVWWCNYFVAPQVPYRIVMEPQNDLQGPIAGKTYANGGYETDEPKHFAVTVQDQFGDPIEGVDVLFTIETTDAAPTDAAPTDAVFLSPLEAVGYHQELVLNSPQTLIVKTNAAGRAFPPGIRFSGEGAKKTNIKVGLINNGISLPAMTRTTVNEQVTLLKFPGHFLHSSTLSNVDLEAAAADEMVTAVTLTVKDRMQRAGANKQVTIRSQTISGKTPVSMLWEKSTPLLKAEFKSLVLDENGKFTIGEGDKAKKFKLASEGKPASSVEYVNSRLSLRFQPPEKGFYLLQFYETNEAGAVVKDGDKPKKIPGQLVFEVVD